MPPAKKGPLGGDTKGPAGGWPEEAAGRWHFERRFVSAPEAIRAILTEVRAFLSAPERAAGGRSGTCGAQRASERPGNASQRAGETAPVAAAMLGRIGMVLAEALNNVAEHAYAGRPGRAILLRLRVIERGVLVQIEDHGAAMPGNRPPAGRLPRRDVELDELPEGGFGWYLIRAQTEAVHYRRVNGMNQLLLVFAARDED